MDIRNMKDLQKHLGTSAGIKNMLNQSNVKQALISEMERLQAYLIEEMNAHYSSYNPVQYERTGAWLESIRVNPVKQLGNEFSISLTFDDNFAYHPSRTSRGEDGYVPWLMEMGWKNHSYTTPHFEGFSGTHYIRNAVSRWNRDNRFGFTISVYHGNERYI